MKSFVSSGRKHPPIYSLWDTEFGLNLGQWGFSTSSIVRPWKSLGCHRTEQLRSSRTAFSTRKCGTVDIISSVVGQRTACSNRKCGVLELVSFVVWIGELRLSCTAFPSRKCDGVELISSWASQRPPIVADEHLLASFSPSHMISKLIPSFTLRLSLCDSLPSAYRVSYRQHINISRPHCRLSSLPLSSPPTEIAILNTHPLSTQDYHCSPALLTAL